MMKLLILIIAIFAICNANPIRDELHARVNQLSELKNQLEHAKHAFLRFQEVAAQTHRVHTEILNNANSKRDTRATQECLAALANLNQVSTNGSCSVSLATYFSFTNTSSSQKQQAVTNFCANCQQPYVQAVKGVITACNISDFGQDLIRAAGFYPRFICAQVNGQFCANVINDLSSQVPTDITKFDDSLLGKICTPCVSLALNILQQGSVSDLALYTRSVLVLRGVCVKIAGKFCFGQIRDNYNTLLQVGAKLNSTDMNASDLEKVLNFFCSPCYRLVAARLALSSGVQGFDLIGSFSVVGALCRKNAAREFCLVKIFDAAKPFLAAGVTGGKLPCDNSGSSNGTCSSDCQNVIKNFVNKGGCCWAILVDFVTKIGPGADSQVKDAIYAGLKQCVPDLKIPDPCVSVAKATIKLTYTNLIVNNQQAFISAVLKDLAVAVGQYDSVDSASITVTTNKRANEASISIPVTTSGTLGATLNVPETVCSSVCGTTPIADPTAEVTVRSETSNLSVTSSSSFLTFSFALFFILSVFFF